MSQNTQAASATKSKFSVRDICYAGLFAAVIAVMAQISIPMPLGVPKASGCSVKKCKSSACPAQKM